jgi:hypothetical protein
MTCGPEEGGMQTAHGAFGYQYQTRLNKCDDRIGGHPVLNRGHMIESPAKSAAC